MLQVLSYVYATVVAAIWALSPVCVPRVATHYGEAYNGQQMACPGSGTYSSENPSILAVGYDSPFQCDDHLLIVGDAGINEVWVSDRCPGCTGIGYVDMSEAGINKVCGEGSDICQVKIIKYEELPKAIRLGIRPEEVSTVAYSTEGIN